MNLERKPSPLFKNSLDLLTTSKKIFILQIVGTIIIILGVLFFIFFQNGLINKLEKRLNKKDVVILTNAGIINTKTITDKVIIIKQFAQLTLLMTLNYDNRSPLAQINFMRNYASPSIYKGYLKMISNEAKLSHKIYTTYIDTTKPIIVKQLKNKNLYQVVLYGIQYIYSELGNKTFHIKLTLIVENNNNSMPDNLYNLEIISYNLSKNK